MIQMVPFEWTVAWIERLLDLWAAAHCASDSDRPRRAPYTALETYLFYLSLASVSSRGAYFRGLRTLPGDALWVPAGGTGGIFLVLTVALGAEYPPSAPSVIGADMHKLTTVFTDILYWWRCQIQRALPAVRDCHLQAIDHGAHDRATVQRGLPVIGCKSVAYGSDNTPLTPHSSQEVRQEYMDQGLLARLGLLLGLDRHLRVLRVPIALLMACIPAIPPTCSVPWSPWFIWGMVPHLGQRSEEPCKSLTHCRLKTTL
ncbi:hypothetical protein MSAN_00821000 [Mycena sanguinolenta]|uniref:Uncharacterized protein n=1 Tax=Mycena sanguinolenta TaxID=230812 RepID=A0A8H6YUX3_9AGAR|nr:hypothetical protein MSAN_00821000 [Mycena sanguinolenta]